MRLRALPMPVKYARFDSDRFKLAVSDMHAGNLGISQTLDPAQAAGPGPCEPGSVAYYAQPNSRPTGSPPATPTQAVGLGREGGARPPGRNGGIWTPNTRRPGAPSLAGRSQWPRAEPPVLV